MVNTSSLCSSLLWYLPVLGVGSVVVFYMWKFHGPGKDSGKGYKGFGMEGWIARWYARITKKDQMEIEKLADRLSKLVPPNGSCVEVAPGPGYLSIALSKRGKFSITGLDISHTFVKMANDNARKENSSARFIQGNASSLPFEDNSFDLIICRAAFKNFSHPIEALDEMHRVLKPSGGKAMILDLNKEATYKEISDFVASQHYSWIEAQLVKLIFLSTLQPWSLSSQKFREMVQASTFKTCEIVKAGIVLEVNMNK